ncbi:hypothetical protein L7F22_062871 [Adiantum nelumboides]|nr:hypothetical protein [Adiantum nelumboides]
MPKPKAVFVMKPSLEDEQGDVCKLHPCRKGVVLRVDVSDLEDKVELLAEEEATPMSLSDAVVAVRVGGIFEARTNGYEGKAPTEDASSVAAASTRALEKQVLAQEDINVSGVLRDEGDLNLGFLLSLQFVYAVWQFVRVAKFFRVPGALVYHLWLWITKREFKGCKPFSRQTIVQVVQGTKWIYNARVENCLRDDDIRLNEGHYLQRRRNVDYVVLQKDVAFCNILDRHSKVAGNNNTCMFLCAEADLILPNVYIADAYEWAEGFEKFLQEGASGLILRANVLLMSSREHFLNQNFMRLLSIFPLMLQAKGFDYISIYASICIIVLDQLSYPANHVWTLFLDLMVDLGKLLISRIPYVKMRQFISTFMATISPRLAFSDQLGFCDTPAGVGGPKGRSTRESMCATVLGICEYCLAGQSSYHLLPTIVFLFFGIGVLRWP